MNGLRSCAFRLRSLSLALSITGLASLGSSQCTVFQQPGTLVQGVTCVFFNPQFTGLLYQLEDYGTFQVGNCVTVTGFLATGGPSVCQQGNGIVAENQIFACGASGVPGLTFCAGDGLDPLMTTPCPCGNVGAPGSGCGNSANALGASLQI